MGSGFQAIHGVFGVKWIVSLRQATVNDNFGEIRKPLSQKGQRKQLFI